LPFSCHAPPPPDESVPFFWQNPDPVEIAVVPFFSERIRGLLFILCHSRPPFFFPPSFPSKFVTALNFGWNNVLLIVCLHSFFFIIGFFFFTVYIVEPFSGSPLIPCLLFITFIPFHGPNLLAAFFLSSPKIAFLPFLTKSIFPDGQPPCIVRAILQAKLTDPTLKVVYSSPLTTLPNSFVPVFSKDLSATPFLLNVQRIP